MSIASCTSPPASAFTFPISRVISSDSSGLCRSRSCAKRKRMLPRSGAGTSRQSSQAACAVATARSTSAAVERGNDSITSPVEGFRDQRWLWLSCGDPSRGAASSRRRRSRERPRQRAAGGGRGSSRRSLDRRRSCPVAAVGAFAAVDDHRHVRVVLVVLDEVAKRIRLELARDDAEDHSSSVGVSSARGSPSKWESCQVDANSSPAGPPIASAPSCPPRGRQRCAGSPAARRRPTLPRRRPPAVEPEPCPPRGHDISSACPLARSSCSVTSSCPSSRATKASSPNAVGPK